jgi:hypothetical protein
LNCFVPAGERLVFDLAEEKSFVLDS